MHHDDVHAGNLFHRLFSYSPRPARSPLEDFCTEALAWCLLQQSTFQSELLGEIRSSLELEGKLEPLLKAYAGKLRVSTQLSYRGVPVDAETTDASAGRLDLVLQSVAETQFVIAIESKVRTDSGLNDQLKDYKDALQKLPEWQRVSECYVVSLTPASHRPPNADAHLSWTKIHRLLDKAVKREDEPAQHRTTFKQFADFLDNRGLNLISLMCLTPDQIQSFEKSASFFDQAKKLFVRFADYGSLKEMFPARTRIPIVTYARNTAWYGISASDDLDSAEFYFRDGKMGLCLVVSVPGDLSKNTTSFSPAAQNAIQHAELLFPMTTGYNKDKDRTSFWFTRPCDGLEETSVMLDWFATCAADAQRSAPLPTNQGI